MKLNALTIGLVICLLLGACSPKKYVVESVFLGKEQTLELGDAVAVQLAEGKEVPELEKYDSREMDNELIVEITRAYSIDVATLYALNRLYKIPQNKIHQDAYYQHLAQLINGDQPEELEKLKNKHFLFAPSFGYQFDTTTGGNFATQRRLLDRVGIPNEIIEINEFGFTAENAQIVADKILEVSASHKDIVLVSASKGGPEVAIALGKLLSAEQSKHVSGWVSISGTFYGSPSVDPFLKGIKGGVARYLFKKRGADPEVLKDLSYKHRKTEFKKYTFPKHIDIIHINGIPLPSQVKKRIKKRYRLIKKNYGPNDGLTTIPDAIVTSKGIVITELGLDHFFKHETIELKTLALFCLLADN